jgi:hypothetical protein
VYLILLIQDFAGFESILGYENNFDRSILEDIKNYLRDKMAIETIFRNVRRCKVLMTDYIIYRKPRYQLKHLSSSC